MGWITKEEAERRRGQGRWPSASALLTGKVTGHQRTHAGPLTPRYWLVVIFV